MTSQLWQTHPKGFNSNNSAACGDVSVAKQSIILIKIYFNAIEFKN